MTILIGLASPPGAGCEKVGQAVIIATINTTMCMKFSRRLSTRADEVTYDRAMDSRIEPSQLSGLAPDTISISKVNLSLGTGAARVHILKDISLRVASGEALGLIGPSGSGKSTLLMVMAGLERPDSGEVVVNGTPFNALDEDALARFRGRQVGIVFQSFHLIPTMTALENVAVPLELAGNPDAAQRAAQELTSVGLGDRLRQWSVGCFGLSMVLLYTASGAFHAVRASSTMLSTDSCATPGMDEMGLRTPRPGTAKTIITSDEHAACRFYRRSTIMAA